MNFLFESLAGGGLEAVCQETNEILAKKALQPPRKEQWQLLFSCIDHTSLDANDHEAGIRNFCRQVRLLGDSLAEKRHVAGICVYPVFAGVVSEELKGSGIKTACVAGAFPTGLSPLPVRLMEARYALDQGSEEIDMVISRGKLKSGDYSFVFDEVAAFREACGKRILKVILETGELKDPVLIARASEIALRAGADFLKTSTGKGTTGATPEALLIMMKCVLAYFYNTGKRAGIKASGGISEPNSALDCLWLLEEVLGDPWLNPEYFRIGASRLTEKIALQYLS